MGTNSPGQRLEGCADHGTAPPSTSLALPEDLQKRRKYPLPAASTTSRHTLVAFLLFGSGVDGDVCDAMLLNYSLSGWLAILALKHTASAALFDAPATENFVRRIAARAVVLGDYVYVDGGLITQLVDGKLAVDRTENQGWLPCHITLTGPDLD